MHAVNILSIFEKWKIFLKGNTQKAEEQLQFYTDAKTKIKIYPSRSEIIN